jgi:hypothetical protein
MEHKTYSNKKKRKTLKKQLKSYKNKDGSQKENSLERKMRLFLENEGIYYIQEYGITYNKKYKSYDFCITDGLNYFFLCEVDGSFWHSDKPLSEMNKIQKKNHRNDLLKDKIAKEMGIPLLRIREDEIKYQMENIRKRIYDEINRQKT